VASAGTVVSVVAQRALWERWEQPSRKVLEAVTRIAEGDFTTRIRAVELGPLGHYAEVLNRLADSQRRMIAGIVRVLDRLQEIPEQVYDSMEEIDSGRMQTEEAVEETASLLANIDTSIRGITGEVESLLSSTEEASSSILEMQSSIEQVSQSVGSLHDSVESSSASIQGMTASMREVAQNADAVHTVAEESAVAMTEMDRAIQEVGEHVRQASVLTDQVNERAEEGSEAVAATIEGIRTIRDQTRDTKEVLERLAERTGEIGEIVNVIGSINAETNLLSLNAAIIAAQAGEQGKAFAVVANHVKTLAQRTASSTKEIEALIRAVQEESSNAVSAMASGIEAVEAGVARSRTAGDQLTSIRASSHEASARVAEIARATAEQTRNSKHVAKAAQQTSSMVQQISSAVGQQSRAGDELLKNAESALELCRLVHRSTEEQRESSRFVTASISAINDMVRSIQSNTEHHGVASQAVAEAVRRILEVARKSGERTPEVMSALAELREQARSLAGTTGAQAGAPAPNGDTDRRDGEVL
jgi:methyl-accepting chemotaxis protein